MLNNLFTNLVILFTVDHNPAHNNKLQDLIPVSTDKKKTKCQKYIFLNFVII